uniref:SIP domain-containing protein n=1 Tax=Clavibacter capsici TaxID=1874630 RepID=UPI00374D35EB
TGKTAEQINEDGDRDRWFTAQEALEYGFVDHIRSRTTDAVPGAPLVAAARALARPDGDVEVFAHGERGAMKELRALLQDGWGIDRRALSLSAYWALGRAEDRFQAEKREPVGAIFAD